MKQLHAFIRMQLVMHVSINMLMNCYQSTHHHPLPFCNDLHWRFLTPCINGTHYS